MSATASVPVQGVLVTLSESDVRRITFLAWQRNRKKSRVGVRTRRFAKGHDDLSIHILGMMAELAVARFLGIPYDPEFRLRGEGNAPDLIDPVLGSIQVKYRDRRGWDLALTGNDPRELSADLAILVWPAPEEAQPADGGEAFEIVGYVTPERFEQRATTRNYGYGERLVLDPEHLDPIAQIAPEQDARAA